MTTVPTFSVPQVDPTNTPVPYQSATAGSERIATNAGRQLGGIGGGISNLGIAGADIAIKQAQDDNQRNATDLDNKLSEGLRNIAFGDGTDDNPGFFSSNGQQAIDQQPAAKAAADKLASDLISNSDANPRVRQMYLQQAQQRVSALYGQMAQHTSQQRQIAQEQTYTARQTEAYDNAAANYNNPDELAKQSFIAVQAAHNISTMKGEGADATSLRAQQAASDVAKGAILAALSQEDNDTAMALYSANKTVLVGDDRVSIQKLVTEQTLSQRGQELAGEAMAKFPGNVAAQADYIDKHAAGKLQDAAISEAIQRNSINEHQVDRQYELGNRAREQSDRAAVENAGVSIKTYMQPGDTARAGLTKLDQDQEDNPTKHTAAQWTAMRSLLTTLQGNQEHNADRNYDLEQRTQSKIEHAADRAFTLGQQDRTKAADAAADNAGADFKKYFLTGDKKPQDALADLYAAREKNPSQFTDVQWDAMAAQGAAYQQNADYVEQRKTQQDAKTAAAEVEGRTDDIVAMYSDADTGDISNENIKAAQDAAAADHKARLAAIGDDPDKIQREEAQYKAVQADIDARVKSQDDIKDRAYQATVRADAQKKQQEAQDLKSASTSLSSFLRNGKGDTTTAQWVAANAQEHPELVQAYLGDFSLGQNAERLQNDLAAGKNYAEVPNEGLFQKIRSMPANELATYDLSLMQTQLSKPEYDKLTSLQNGAIKQATSIEQSGTYAHAVAMVDDYIPKDQKKANPDGVITLKNEMAGFVNDFINTNHKAPTDPDIRAHLNSLIAPLVSYGNVFNSSLGNVGAFTAQSTPEQTTAALRNVRVAKEDIPPQTLQALQTYITRQAASDPALKGLKLSKMNDDALEHLAGLYLIGQNTRDLKARDRIQAEIYFSVQDALTAGVK